MSERIVEPREVSLEEAFSVHKQIPEFAPNPPKTLEDFQKEIDKADNLILVAYLDSVPVGYVVGYDKFKDGSFYSWMGGVIPEYREFGVYKVLKNFQEELVKQKGYKSIKVKTWNRRVEMRIFLAKSGYNIIALEEKSNPLDNRLMHEKIL